MNAKRFESDRRALQAVWRKKRMFGLHVAANLVLFGLVWLWLSLPESRVWQLLLSALLAAAIATGGLWLHGATLHFFRRVHQDDWVGVADSFRAALRRLPALVVWAGLSWVAFALIARVAALAPTVAEWISSALTFFARRPVPPGWTELALAIPLGFVMWIAAPLVLLLLGSAMSEEGFGALRGYGLDRSIAAARRLGLWLRCAILVSVGVYLPHRLVEWVPGFEGIRAQAASMTARFLVAYLLAIAAWLVLASVIGRAGRAAVPPVLTDPSAV